jgi:hypothetical protein
VVEEAGALAPDPKEKLRLGVAVVEGSGGGDVHGAGARQGELVVGECEEE